MDDCDPALHKHWAFWSIMETHAEGTASNLQAAWERPVRHNLRLERLALWHTVELDRFCERTTNGVSYPQIREHITPQLEPEAAYEFRAATLMVPRLVPFEVQSDRLRGRVRSIFEGWGRDMAQLEPHAVENWHRWVWDFQDDGAGLVVAATRISESLREVIG